VLYNCTAVWHTPRFVCEAQRHYRIPKQQDTFTCSKSAHVTAPRTMKSRVHSSKPRVRSCACFTGWNDSCRFQNIVCEGLVVNASVKQGLVFMVLQRNQCHQRNQCRQLTFGYCQRVQTAVFSPEKDQSQVGSMTRRDRSIERIHE
jgi:hypothetical protein